MGPSCLRGANFPRRVWEGLISMVWELSPPQAHLVLASGLARPTLRRIQNQVSTIQVSAEAIKLQISLFLPLISQINFDHFISVSLTKGLVHQVLFFSSKKGRIRRHLHSWFRDHLTIKRRHEQKSRERLYVLICRRF